MASYRPPILKKSDKYKKEKPVNATGTVAVTNVPKVPGTIALYFSLAILKLYSSTSPGSSASSL